MVKNVAGKKKVVTPLDFAKVFVKLDLMEKTLVSGKLSKTLETGVSKESGHILSDHEKKVINGIHNWSMMNILIGNELCPPVSVKSHVKTALK